MNQKDIERFWSKVDKSGGIDACWIWITGKSIEGYGHFWFGSRNFQAHRVAWNLHFGDIPLGLCVLHSCDNPPCVNPRHLFLGTHQDNMDDRKQKGRGAALRGAKNPNHRLSDSQISEIRRLYKIGGVTQAELANDFGVDQSHISCVVNYKRWT